MKKGTEEYKAKDRERAREYRVLNRAEILERKKKRDEEHRQEIRARQREWMKTPAGQRARARRLARYAVNRKFYIQAAIDWKKNNPERAAATGKKWYRKDPAYQLLRHAKARARKLGLPCTLRVADIVVPQTCPVLGIPLIIGAGRPTPNSPTIDRILPHLGYVKDNARVISYRANILKRDASLKEIEAIAAYMRRELAEARPVAAKPTKRKLPTERKLPLFDRLGV